MSQPTSVKWILPFREFLTVGFQSLPLTLAGTSAFFAANTTSPFFILLTGILSVIIPVMVYLTQMTGGFIHGKLHNETTSRNWFIIAIVVAFSFINAGWSIASPLVMCAATPLELFSRFSTQIISIVGFFAANAMMGPSAQPIEISPNLACNIVGIVRDKNPMVSNVPSYWLTPVVFLTTYLFKNAIDNYQKPASETADPMKVAKRKIQSSLALTSILAVGLLLIAMRLLVTGCENAISLIISSLLGIYIGGFFYDLIAKPQGIDAFNMFQNIYTGVPVKEIKCFKTD